MTHVHQAELWRFSFFSLFEMARERRQGRYQERVHTLPQPNIAIGATPVLYGRVLGPLIKKREKKTILGIKLVF